LRFRPHRWRPGLSGQPISEIIAGDRDVGLIRGAERAVRRQAPERPQRRCVFVVRQYGKGSEEQPFRITRTPNRRSQHHRNTRVLRPKLESSLARGVRLYPRVGTGHPF
jgi:hypothetical protein